jgi:acetyltransferase-like isoleucine patch superfamily enzyme
MGIIKTTIKKYHSILPWKLWGPGYRLVSGNIGLRSKFRTSQVGKDSYVDPSVLIIGWENITIGNNTTLSEDIWLNVNHREQGAKRIVIGNNCHIGKRNFLSSGPLIHINDYSFTGLDCHFLGCGHITDFPMVPYIASGLTPGDVIEVGANCWLTTAVTVLQGVRIGHGSIIGAQSVVLNDIPPFSIAVGNPCKVLKRYDFKMNRWVDISDWTDELNELIPSECEYLSRLRNEWEVIPMSLVGSSRRFGWL